MRKISQNVPKEAVKKCVKKEWNVAMYVRKFVMYMIVIKINVLNLVLELIKIADIKNINVINCVIKNVEHVKF